MHHARRSTRALAVAIAALQLGGLTAIAHAGLAADAPPPPGTELSARDGGEVAAATSGAAQPAAPVTATSAPPAPTITVPATAAPSTTSPPVPAAPPTTVAEATATTPPPPPPAPRATPAPAPAPPPAPPQELQRRVEAAHAASVPAAWRQAIPVRLEVVPGDTSWARSSGVIQVSETHARGSEAVLRATLAHEFGHLIAFRYGSQRFLGAAPEGWPPYSHDPAEAWADCVARAMTGIDDPSHGVPSCGGASLSWTADWLGQGAGAHPRTA